MAVAGLLVEVVAEGLLLDRIATGDHVEQQAAAGQLLEGGPTGQLRGRRDRIRPEGDDELGLLGVLRDRGTGQPDVPQPEPVGSAHLRSRPCSAGLATSARALDIGRLRHRGRTELVDHVGHVASIPEVEGTSASGARCFQSS